MGASAAVVKEKHGTKPTHEGKLPSQWYNAPANDCLENYSKKTVLEYIRYMVYHMILITMTLISAKVSNLTTHLWITIQIKGFIPCFLMDAMTPLPQ